MTDPSAFSFVVQASPTNGATWTAFAQRIEVDGFDALVVADHPGMSASPFVALAAAGAVTTTLGLGTAVINGGVREPFDIAADVATLSLLSGDRVFLGLGAGHTPAEWTAVGREYPSPGDRSRRLAEQAPLIRQLLAGETVTHDGAFFTLRDAHIDVTPAAEVPMLIGGNGLGTIRLGARVADIVEIGGLGKTLADGHTHEVRWQPSQIDRLVDVFRTAAGDRAPMLGALVQMVVITDDAEAVAATVIERVATRQPADTIPTAAELIASPFALVGTVAEIVGQVHAAREQWGISRYTIRADTAADMAPVIAALGQR